MTWPAPLPNVPRIDWFRVLMDLKSAGLSLNTIASFVQVSKTSVIGWKNHDAEPGHMHGERLLLLWCRSTGNVRENIPRAIDLTTVKPGEVHQRRQPCRCPMCGATSQVEMV